MPTGCEDEVVSQLVEVNRRGAELSRRDGRVETVAEIASVWFANYLEPATN